MTFTRIRQAQVQLLSEDLQKIKEQIKTFKAPIPLLENMPLDDNNDGDLRVCLENGKVYVWKQSEEKWMVSSGISGTYGKIINLNIERNGQAVIETNIKFNDPKSDFQTNSTAINLYLNGVLISSECYKAENINDKLVITWLDMEYPLCENDIIGIQYYDVLGGYESSGDGGNLSRLSRDILPLEPNKINIGSDDLSFNTIYTNRAKILSNFIEINGSKTDNIIGIKLNHDKDNEFLLILDKQDNELKFGKQEDLNSIAYKFWTEEKIDEKIKQFSESEKDLTEEEIMEIIEQII